jgi:Flp pilus assembly protein TadG
MRREQWTGRCARPGPGTGAQRRQGGKRGAALVEFVIVVPLLLLLVLGIMEFGMIMHDYIMLAQGAREGARTAAIGKPVADIRDRVMAASLPSVRPEMIQITTYDQGSGGWAAVADKASGGQNNVPQDGIVRVTIKDYPHHMVTGNFFSWLPGYSNGAMNLNASLTMRRE